ncbi:MAG TPA: hypothetical protein VG897_03125 [Terriglobales bacterium]|nr:hypothetical protein [Terriglobales bacterium]
MRAAQLLAGIILAIIGAALLYLRNRLEFYSVRAGSPADARYFGSPISLTIAGICCIAAAVILIVRISKL